MYIHMFVCMFVRKMKESSRVAEWHNGRTTDRTVMFLLIEKLIKSAKSYTCHRFSRQKRSVVVFFFFFLKIKTAVIQ